MRTPRTEFDRLVQRCALGDASPRTERCRGFKKNGCTVKVLEYSGRCGDCQAEREAYASGSFGLDALVGERLHNEALGLCLFCGKAKEEGARLCSDCDYSTKEREYVLEHHRAKRTPNPYKNVFDRIEDHEEVDGQMVLVPNGETIALRDEATARHWQVIADWEGNTPDGRAAQKKAHTYRQLAQTMRNFHEKVKRLSR